MFDTFLLPLIVTRILGHILCQVLVAKIPRGHRVESNPRTSDLESDSLAPYQQKKNLFTLKSAWILNSSFTFFKVKFTFFHQEKFSQRKKRKSKKTKWNKKSNKKSSNTCFFLLFSFQFVFLLFLFFLQEKILTNKK